MRRCFAPFTLLAFLAVLSACSGDPGAQVPDAGTTSQPSRGTSGQAPPEEENAPALDLSPPSPTLAITPKPTPAPTPSPTPTPIPTAAPQVTPTVVAAPAVIPVATPGLAPGQRPAGSQNEWVRQRVSAIVSLYNVSQAGREWLESYDLRQMVGRPGWFGSLGYDQWAGVGQAIPRSVIHEISHSYYGAFPISGHPQLTWKRGPGEDISPATARFRQDLITFMFQPPDRYEPLRERFRNLPNLSREEDPDLFHFGEAEVLYTTGGSLNLIPPILRKYFDQFLDEGGFETWEEALTWHLGLSTEDKKTAEAYIGLSHIPMKDYHGLEPSESTRLPVRIKSIAEAEERQRLIDFAQQFDLIKTNEFSFVDAASVDRSFQFWRDYLREMKQLHEKHPHVLAGAGERGPILANALDTFLDARDMSQNQQIEYFKDQLQDPFLMNFSVLLPSGVLIELFGDSTEELPLDSLEGVVGSFSQKLARYARQADDVLSTGREDLHKGSAKLELFLQRLTDDQQEKDLTLIFELLREADRVTSKNLLNLLSDDLILHMSKNKPSAVRNGMISTDRLLQVLGITTQNSHGEIVQGLKLLFEQTSGNFEIDRPFTNLAYDVIGDVAKRDFRAGLAMVRDSEVPVLDFIKHSPELSEKIFSSDPPEAATLIANPRGYARSPLGIIYGLIHINPVLAAREVMEMDRQGMEDIVTESVIVFAYDADRLRAIPSLPISLDNDAQFLERLLKDKGGEWLEERIAQGVELYKQRLESNDVPRDFLAAYERTLREAASRLKVGEPRSTFEDIISRVLR